MRRGETGLVLFARLLSLLIASLLIAVGGVTAQTSDLTADHVRLVEGVGDFGQPTLTAVGEIVNAGAEAYANLFITAQAFDAYIKAETQKWSRVIKTANIKLD